MEATWTSDCGTVRLWNADCREWLEAVDTSEVEAVLTDPPYGIGLRNGDVDGHRSDRWDSIAGDGDQQVGLQVLNYWRERGVPVVAFASPWKPWPGHWRNLIVWNKGGAVGGGGDVTTCLKRSWELVQAHGTGPLLTARDESVWHCPITPADTIDHIAKKPEALLVRLLQTFVPMGATVCDPFMGAGSTAAACIRTGRRFVGVEIDPAHFATSVKRIEAELSRMPLFTEPPIIQRELL